MMRGAFGTIEHFLDNDTLIIPNTETEMLRTPGRKEG